MPDISPRDHLANERTFLAWVRTSISLMGFGVVIAKLRFLVATSGSAPSSTPGSGAHSTLLGLTFAGAGVLTLIFSALHYERTRRALDRGDYRSQPAALYAFTTVIFLLGLAAVAYLLMLSSSLAR